MDDGLSANPAADIFDKVHVNLHVKPRKKKRAVTNAKVPTSVTVKPKTKSIGDERRIKPHIKITADKHRIKAHVKATADGHNVKPHTEITLPRLHHLRNNKKTKFAETVLGREKKTQKYIEQFIAMYKNNFISKPEPKTRKKRSSLILANPVCFVPNCPTAEHSPPKHIRSQTKARKENGRDMPSVKSPMEPVVPADIKNGETHKNIASMESSLVNNTNTESRDTTCDATSKDIKDSLQYSKSVSCKTEIKEHQPIKSSSAGSIPRATEMQNLEFEVIIEKTGDIIDELEVKEGKDHAHAELEVKEVECSAPTVDILATAIPPKKPSRDEWYEAYTDTLETLDVNALDFAELGQTDLLCKRSSKWKLKKKWKIVKRGCSKFQKDCLELMCCVKKREEEDIYTVMNECWG